MTETLTALEVCCCGNCEASGHQKEVIRPLTAKELTEREARIAIAIEDQAKEEAEAKKLADLKASAKAKLIAGTPLTAEEADTLVI